jgi:hypothetical protein
MYWLAERMGPLALKKDSAHGVIIIIIIIIISSSSSSIN